MTAFYVSSNAVGFYDFDTDTIAHTYRPVKALVRLQIENLSVMRGAR
jgi:hypothetical protein